jgi:hypothetical protein
MSNTSFPPTPSAAPVYSWNLPTPPPFEYVPYTSAPVTPPTSGASYWGDDYYKEEGERSGFVITVFVFFGIAFFGAICYRASVQNARSNTGTAATASPGIPAIPEDGPSPTNSSAPIDPKLLRSKVVKAIFAEQTVDKTNLQYDPEANSYRWVNNRQEKNETKNTSCSICLERFIEGDVVVSSVCTHAFHRDCIIGWAEIKDDCPMCRQSMFDVKTYKMLETEIITMGDAESHST